MKGILAWLWHQHHWETVEKYDRMHRTNPDWITGQLFILKCKDCGDIKYRSWP